MDCISISTRVCDRYSLCNIWIILATLHFCSCQLINFYLTEFCILWFSAIHPLSITLIHVAEEVAEPHSTNSWPWSWRLRDRKARSATGPSRPEGVPPCPWKCSNGPNCSPDHRGSQSEGRKTQRWKKTREPSSNSVNWPSLPHPLKTTDFLLFFLDIFIIICFYTTDLHIGEDSGWNRSVLHLSIQTVRRTLARLLFSYFHSAETWKW